MVSFFLSLIIFFSRSFFEMGRVEEAAGQVQVRLVGEEKMGRVR